MGNPAAILLVALAGLGGIAACAAPPLGGGAGADARAPEAHPGRQTASSLPDRGGGGSRAALEASSAETPVRARADAPLPSPEGTAVLHIGDSFAVSGFSQALRPKLEALGVRYEVRSEQSSFTTTWAGRMAKLVADTQPDLVIINLGANEVSNTDPTTHASHVRRIVQAIGDRPCVWVSPPLWRKDTGITDVIRQNSAPCRFFDTDALVTRPIPRQGDHIHPSEAGGAIWAEAFWSWLSTERARPESEPLSVPVSDTFPGALKGSRWRLKPAPPEEHRQKLRRDEERGASLGGKAG